MTDSPFELTWKTILVTGASSGIGQATARLCARMGARVILGGRNKERLAETLEGLPGKDHLAVAADLTLAEERASLIGQIPALDGVVHAAGTGHRKLCKSLTEEDINAVMAANFNAAVLLQAALLTGKKINRGASLVFLSSRTAEVPTVANALYSASKGALQSYAKCLSLELAPRQIRVNCICPAMVWTPLILSEGATEEQLKEQEALYPLKRYGRPEDIANLAVFLLSDAASWMTGSCIDITGGAITI
jgi:NAD(P)-dependent dehydrogenase (short-subunit alcohol dehydrogenase family)